MISYSATYRGDYRGDRRDSLVQEVGHKNRDPQNIPKGTLSKNVQQETTQETVLSQSIRLYREAETPDTEDIQNTEAIDDDPE